MKENPGGVSRGIPGRNSGGTSDGISEVNPKGVECPELMYGFSDEFFKRYREEFWNDSLAEVFKFSTKKKYCNFLETLLKVFLSEFLNRFPEKKVLKDSAWKTLGGSLKEFLRDSFENDLEKSQKGFPKQLLKGFPN